MTPPVCTLHDAPYSEKSQPGVSVLDRHGVPYRELWLTEDARGKPYRGLALDESSYAGHMQYINAYPNDTHRRAAEDRD